MIHQFLIFVAVVSAQTFEPSSKAELESKLDSYQAATGIDDAQKDEIWNTAMDISKF